MKLADGLFLESCREVATKYPGIKYNEIIVDNCCMQLVSKPEQFDVMVFFLMLSHINYLFLQVATIQFKTKCVLYSLYSHLCSKWFDFIHLFDGSYLRIE